MSRCFFVRAQFKKLRDRVGTNYPLSILLYHNRDIHKIELDRINTISYNHIMKDIEKEVCRERTKVAIGLLIFVTIVFVIANINNAYDEKLMLSADRYADCISDQYSMTPVEYYQEHREYPVCNFDINRIISEIEK